MIFFKPKIALLIPASHRKWNSSEKWILGDPFSKSVKAFLTGGLFVTKATDRHLAKPQSHCGRWGSPVLSAYSYYQASLVDDTILAVPSKSQRVAPSHEDEPRIAANSQRLAAPLVSTS